jgi:hypothetical protein
MTAMTFALWAADPFSQLGISEREASQSLLNAVTRGATPYGTPVSMFKTLSGPARGALVQELGAWAKTYAMSAGFRAAYAEYRTSVAPEAPKFEGTVDDEFNRKKASDAAQMAESKKGLEKLPADMRKQAEEAMKQAADMMNTPEMQKLIREGIASSRSQAQEQYQEAMANWQSTFPENPNALIAKQLRRFLEASADVDFNAELVSKGPKMVFANPEYEKKSRDWKFYFRAGREAVAAGRTIATAWLKELGG